MKPIYTLIALFLLLHIQVLSQNIVINELMSSNASVHNDEDGDYADWIELYNPGNSAIQLEGYGLSDDISNPFKWVFPSAVIEPGAFKIVWASGKNRREVDKPLHTNFSLNKEGEPLLLSKADGMLISYLQPVALQSDISYGRHPDGGNHWYYFREATPGASNSAEGYLGILPAPDFSVDPGFYSESFHLTLSSSQPGVEIYFTLDGSEPDIQNPGKTSYPYKNIYPQRVEDPFGELLWSARETRIYQPGDPINITDGWDDQDSLTHKASAYLSRPYYFPNSPVFKGKVVRARATKPGFIDSPVSTAVYFVDPLARQRFSMPVIHIATNPEHLFHYEEGIYNPGVDFDAWRLENPDLDARGGVAANYHRRGPLWEFPAHFSFFEHSSALPDLSQDIGFRIHGGWSRAFPMKTLRLYARGRYGTSAFEYPFFKDQEYSSYKRIIMRNSGNEWQYTMFRDALIQSVISPMQLETMAYRPALVFLNGEYWGIHNMRERYDKHYLERVFGVKEGQIDYLTFDAQAKEGDNVHYLETMDYIRNNDLRLDEHYQYILTRIDTENYIDYQIANIYSANSDWPGNNIDYWRKRTTVYEPNSPYGHDGRWRWMAFDMDFGFGAEYAFEPEFIPHTHNTLAFAAEAGNDDWPNPDWSTFLFRNMLTNVTFQNSFINRFADLLNTLFLPERIHLMISDFQQMLQPEINEHRHRWKTPESITFWNNSINIMAEFAAQRPSYQKKHLAEYFDLAGTSLITVDVDNPAHGRIRINSLLIDSQTPGIQPEPYPWQGTYFRGIPIEAEAIAAEGFRFSHWEGTEHTTVTFTADPSELQVLTAHFTTDSNDDLADDPAYKTLMYFWMFDTSLSNDTPLQEIEARFTIHSDARLQYQSSLAGYPFFEGHHFWRKASLERYNNPSPINYREEGNNYLSYQQTSLRGIQVRQPFAAEEKENALILHLPTQGYENIVLRFAAMDEWAANAILIEYSINNEEPMWSNRNMGQNKFPLSGHYQLFTIDFSDISGVTNNPDFKIRLRFDCDNPFADYNRRVSFNNISLEGDPIQATSIQDTYSKMDNFYIYPNPVRQGENIYFNKMAKVSVYDLSGRLILQKGKSHILQTASLEPGTYILKTDKGETSRIALLP